MAAVVEMRGRDWRGRMLNREVGPCFPPFFVRRCPGEKPSSTAIRHLTCGHNANEPVRKNVTIANYPKMPQTSQPNVIMYSSTHALQLNPEPLTIACSERAILLTMSVSCNSIDDRACDLSASDPPRGGEAGVGIDDDRR